MKNDGSYIKGMPVEDAGGFSLVELGVAIIIFCLGFMGMTKMQNVAVRTNAYTMQMTEATNVMKSTSEKLMGYSRDNSQLGGSGTLSGTAVFSAPSVKPTNISYTPSWTVTQVSGVDLRLVTMTVTWSDQGHNHNVSVTFYK